MATKLKHTVENAGSGGGNVLTLNRCMAEGCGKKSDLLTFCNEHYDWFKFGLVNKLGQRPVDFDKKYMAFQRQQKQKKTA